MTQKQLIDVVECYMRQVYNHDTQEVYVDKDGMDYAIWGTETKQILVVDKMAEVYTLFELPENVRNNVLQSLAKSMCDDVKYAFKLQN